jgi:glutamyl-tRNA reductase
MGMEEVIAEAEANRSERLLELADARTLIDEALVELRRTMADRMLGPLLGALQRRYRQTAAEAVDRLFKKDLGHLSDQDREAILAWAALLARRFAHIPSLGIKGLAYEGGVPAVEAFLAGLDEGLAEELREAARAAGGPRVGSKETDA